MKKHIVTPLMIFGIAFFVVGIVSWIAFPAWRDRPGGIIKLIGPVALGVMAFLKDGVDFFKSFSKKDAPTNTTTNTITSTGDRSPNTIGDNTHIQYADINHVEHYHEASTDEPAPTPLLGVIPPARVEKYVDRGEIEEKICHSLNTDHRALVYGPPGRGKTELVNEIAHRIRDRYTNLLWVDLNDRPAEDVVPEMLRRCGIKPPDTYPEQVQALKAWLQEHSILVILDDLRNVQLKQLSDLLPPAPPCTVLITSRIEQPSQGIPLKNSFKMEPMSSEQGKELFEAVLGEEIVAVEQEAVNKIMERCLWNPLAMEIAARRIRQMAGISHPVQRYLEKLQKSLAELNLPGDERMNLFAVFDQSYADLSAEDQARFRSLAVFDPTGFNPSAAAYVWEMEEPETDTVLARFKNLSLIKSVEGDFERYRLHDLLDEYAQEKLKQEDGKARAQARMADWLIHLFGKHYTDDIDNAPEAALEFANLKRSAQQCLSAGDADRLAMIATTPRNWFYTYFQNWEEWSVWLKTAFRLGISDAGLKADTLQAIGEVQRFRAEYDAALASYAQALGLFRTVGDRLGEANTLKAIGDVQAFRAEYDAALASYAQALTLYRSVGDRLGEANTLAALSRMMVEDGKIQEAEAQLQQAVTIRRAIRDAHGEGADLGNFAIALFNHGDRTLAREYALRARGIFEKLNLQNLVEMMNQLIQKIDEG